MEYCTIVARNYLAGARVLARSVHARLGRRLHVLVIDALDDERDAFREEPFRALLPADVGLDRTELHTMALIYDVTELATAVKPNLLRTLVARTGGTVTYLDPDIVVFSDFGDLDELLTIHDVVVTPHMTRPLDPDGGLPDETVMLQTGVVQPRVRGRGARGGADARLVGRASPPRVPRAPGRGPVRRPAMDGPHAVVLRHRHLEGPGLQRRVLEPARAGRGAGSARVRGRTARRCASSTSAGSRRCTRPRCRSTSSVRRGARFADSPGLTRLFRDYQQDLLAAGYLDAMQVPFRYSATAAGVPIDRFMRVAARHAVLRHDADPEAAAPPDPFDRSTAADFVDVAHRGRAERPLPAVALRDGPVGRRRRVPPPVSPAGRDAGRVPGPPRAVRAPTRGRPVSRCRHPVGGPAATRSRARDPRASTSSATSTRRTAWARSGVR